MRNHDNRFKPPKLVLTVDELIGGKAGQALRLVRCAGYDTTLCTRTHHASEHVAATKRVFVFAHDVVCRFSREVLRKTKLSNIGFEWTTKRYTIVRSYAHDGTAGGGLF